tara:strand:+ start:6263 stop:6787 length:525 start_codon:yes stop_codon:yes gene_type:complete
MQKKTDLPFNTEGSLYNKILFLSRNKLFYTRLELLDSFQNRINLIFFHMCFLNVKIKKKNQNKEIKKIFQNLFDFVFKQIEINMREIGYGDVTVNKNMKNLVKIFYSILLNCESYNSKNNDLKKSFISKYLEANSIKKDHFNPLLIDYFDKYEAFCFDLGSDSVLKGELNFNYK